MYLDADSVVPSRPGEARASHLSSESTWQTYGRSDIPFDDIVKLDYTYVAGWSLREDFRLLLPTATVVAVGRGTY